MIRFKDTLRKVLVSDQKYIERRFERTFGRKIDFNNPKTFNEKINYLKLKGFNNSYSVLADKFQVRDFVKVRIGREYLVKLIDVFSDVDDIDFNKLPRRFVLKVTHGSGYNIVVKDKRDLDIRAVKKRLRKWMKENYYFIGREPVYKSIVPKIICEEFLEELDGTEIKDYKFFCFGGRVDCIQVDNDRSTNHTRDFYNREWEKQKIGLQYPNSDLNEITKPFGFEKMINLAEVLSAGLPFIRVDFYNVNGKVYFGELTFYPENGFGKFYPEPMDLVFGNKLNLV